MIFRGAFMVTPLYSGTAAVEKAQLYFVPSGPAPQLGKSVMQVFIWYAIITHYYAACL